MSYLEKLKQIEEIFKSTYLIVDKGIIKLLIATIIANRFTNDPIWLFLVAPSGAGKSQFINSLNKVLKVFPISTVTSKTFISGKRPKAGEETSLLHIIGAHGILTFTDFTTMLTMHHEERNAIMGQLREIYDGSMTRVFGTGEKVTWKGKLGLIAGVTSVIHTARELYSAMGERFIIYAIELPERLEAARKAMDNTNTILEKRKFLEDEMHKFLDDMEYDQEGKVTKELGGIGMPKDRPKIDPEIKNDLLLLAELSTRARSPVDREWRSPNKEILYVHPPEMPTRFASQLSILASALKLLNGGELLPEDKKILFKITLDSITDTRRIALQELAKYDEVETAGLAVKIDYPTTTVRRWLEDLTALKIVERVKIAGKKADRWKLKASYKKLIQKFEGIETIGSELTEETAEPKSTEEELLADATTALQEQCPPDNQAPFSDQDSQVELSFGSSNEAQSPAFDQDSSSPTP